jgi:hypothetical protein
VAAEVAMYLPHVRRMPACPPPYLRTAYPPVINTIESLGKSYRILRLHMFQPRYLEVSYTPPDSNPSLHPFSLPLET